MFSYSETTKNVGVVPVLVAVNCADSIEIGLFHHSELDALVETIRRWGLHDEDGGEVYQAADVSGGFELCDGRFAFLIAVYHDQPGGE